MTQRLAEAVLAGIALDRYGVRRCMMWGWLLLTLCYFAYSRVQGLAACVAYHDELEEQRDRIPFDMDGVVAKLDDLGLRECSMGMSADLEIAVAEGATMVRVGTDIFGPRPAAR